MISSQPSKKKIEKSKDFTELLKLFCQKMSPTISLTIENLKYNIFDFIMIFASFDLSHLVSSRIIEGFQFSTLEKISYVHVPTKNMPSVGFEKYIAKIFIRNTDDSKFLHRRHVKNRNNNHSKRLIFNNPMTPPMYSFLF